VPRTTQQLVDPPANVGPQQSYAATTKNIVASHGPIKHEKTTLTASNGCLANSPIGPNPLLGLK